MLLAHQAPQPEIQEKNVAVSFKDNIFYIVCNNKTTSSQQRVVWHLHPSNMTWSLDGMISVPYSEEKLRGHFFNHLNILLICSTASCTKYKYHLDGWSIKERIQFGANNAPVQVRFHLQLLKAASLLLANAIFIT